ncbi:hypothetical protein AB0I98_38795 [Streptomyces sp. NPDC050211]|uniref:hypothetical protein n=1 Tax=Streptomyces sp. NPDC050211 TaxID=3154932 RepID=UPI00343A872D
MPVLRGTSVMTVMVGVLVLTGCQDASGSHVGSGALSSSSPSAHASAMAGTRSNGPATTTPTAATSTPSPSRTSAAPAKAVSPAPTGTLTTPANDHGCRNLTVSNEVKAPVTRAYQRSFPRFVHVQPVPHQFFYGQCGGVRYAATRFEATPGATHEELVGMQDEGSATKYFRGTSRRFPKPWPRHGGTARSCTELRTSATRTGGGAGLVDTGTIRRAGAVAGCGVRGAG